jgi:hypothetical protein
MPELQWEVELISGYLQCSIWELEVLVIGHRCPTRACRVLRKAKKMMAAYLILKFNVILLKLCDFLPTIPGEWRLTCTDDVVPLRGDYRCKKLTASQLLIVRKQF